MDNENYIMAQQIILSGLIHIIVLILSNLIRPVTYGRRKAIIFFVILETECVRACVCVVWVTDTKFLNLHWYHKYCISFVINIAVSSFLYATHNPTILCPKKLHIPPNL